jgi:hypothetical protein
VCGKKQGKLVDRRPARFPYAMVCVACGWTTDWVRIDVDRDTAAVE